MKACFSGIFISLRTRMPTSLLHPAWYKKVLAKSLSARFVLFNLTLLIFRKALFSSPAAATQISIKPEPVIIRDTTLARFTAQRPQRRARTTTRSTRWLPPARFRPGDGRARLFYRPAADAVWLRHPSSEVKRAVMRSPSAGQATPRWKGTRVSRLIAS